jgi:undecaprenyl-diphosphatase
MDFIMYWLSNRPVWIPLYVFLIALLFKKYGRQTLYLLLSVAILVFLTDQVSVHLFKNVFLRLRPCHDPLLQGMVRTLNGECGGSYGFVSSHAANTFGLAVFLFPFLRSTIPGLSWIIIAWAAVVSFSRIYLGVHFPLDVIVGAMLGILLGFSCRRLAMSMIKNFP